jgi:hypothetical protein
MLHPIWVLAIVMFIGIIALPVARGHGIVPRGMEADLIAVAVLIMSYMAYKSWWTKQQGK